MALDTDFTSSGYDSYLTLDEVNACVATLDGCYDISKWTALDTPALTVMSLVVVSLVATVTTAAAHGFVTGDSVLIEGADNVNLNGTFTVTVTSTTEFTYVTAEADETATGTITATDATLKASNDAIKENLIKGATRDMNMFLFLGVISNAIISPFNMKWPRTDAFYVNGVKIGNTEIPEFICCYIAERIIEKQAQKKNGSFYNGRIKKSKVGELETEFQNPRDSRLLKSTIRSNPSFDCVRPYVLNSSNNMRFLTRA